MHVRLWLQSLTQDFASRYSERKYRKSSQNTPRALEASSVPLNCLASLPTWKVEWCSLCTHVRRQRRSSVSTAVQSPRAFPVWLNRHRRQTGNSLRIKDGCLPIALQAHRLTRQRLACLPRQAAIVSSNADTAAEAVAIGNRRLLSGVVSYDWRRTWRLYCASHSMKQSSDRQIDNIRSNSSHAVSEFLACIIERLCNRLTALRRFTNLVLLFFTRGKPLVIIIIITKCTSTAYEIYCIVGK